MEVITVPESEDSENSVIEVEVPKKPTPPLVEIEEDEMILNVNGESQQNILARDLICNDIMLGNKSSHTQLNMKNYQCASNPSHWTVDMIKFYNDDWGGEEDFIVEKIQEKMSKSPSLWQISRKDYLRMRNKSPRYDIKCLNCCHYGHHFSDCPEPPYVPKCHMCGRKGHNYNVCPNSKCLNCGSSFRKYVVSCPKCKNQEKQKCSRCSLLGHRYIDCPDHWRLFHLTTNSMSVVVPDKDVHKLKRDLWCCNCGDRGHHHTVCLQMKSLQYGDTLPFIVSYKKAFEFNQYKNKSKGNPRKKFKERRNEDQMEKIKINDLNRAVKQSKFNLLNYNFKKFHRFKKHDKRRCNKFL